jgi:hypothetical protein
MDMILPIIAEFPAMILFMGVVVAMTGFIADGVAEKVWWRNTIIPFPLLLFVWGVEWAVIAALLWGIEVML